MQSINDISTNVSDTTTIFFTPDSFILIVFKLAFILVAVMYVVYSFVIVRQVSIMNDTLDTPLGPVIKLAAWIHLLFAIAFSIGALLFL